MDVIKMSSYVFNRREGTDDTTGLIADQSTSASREGSEGEGEPIAVENDAGTTRQHNVRPNGVGEGGEEGDHQAPNNRQEEEEEEDSEEMLKYGAKSVMMQIYPVSICLLVVVTTFSSVTFFTQNSGQYLLYTPFHEEGDISIREKVGQANANANTNALIIIGVILVMTVVLVILYKCGCYKIIISGWLIMSSLILLSFFSNVYIPLYTPFIDKGYISTGEKVGQAIANALISFGVILVMTVVRVILDKCICYKIISGWLIMPNKLMLLFFFSYVYIQELLKAYNIAMDYITCALILWNFGVVGMISIHWKGPLFLQQVYLILYSALMALIVIKYLPDWTTLLILGKISLYATMRWCVLMGMAYRSSSQNERELQPPEAAAVVVEDVRPAEDDEEEEIPMRWSVGMGMADRSSPQNERELQPPAAAAVVVEDVRPAEDDKEERVVKLGLGDFIFYSVLVGKASSYNDWHTTIACFVAILFGLCLTVLHLAIFRKAISALPISFTLGVIFCFATKEFIKPFCDTLSSERVFI